MALHDAWRARLHTYHHVMQDNLEVQPVMDFINSKKGLSHRLVTKIEARHSAQERVATFLDTMVHDAPDKGLEIFIEGLLETKQEHLARLVIGIGKGVKMSEEHKSILENHRLSLIHDMEVDILVPHLHSKDILTEYDVKMINSKVTREEEVACLLDVVTKKADDAFECLKEGLNITAQDHLACLLQTKDESLHNPSYTEWSQESQRLKKEAEELKSNIEKMSDLTGEAQLNKSDVDQLKLQMDSLNSQMRKINSGIADMEERLADLPRLDKLKQSNDAKDVKIYGLEASLETHERHLKTAAEEIEKYKKENKELKDLIEEREAYIAVLEEQSAVRNTPL